MELQIILSGTCLRASCNQPKVPSSTAKMSAVACFDYRIMAMPERTSLCLVRSLRMLKAAHNLNFMHCFMALI
eukprot:5919456-Pleurochrysis_carterae.AAC.1